MGSRVRKWYDEARTPYQRVLARADVDEAEKNMFREAYRTLNPVALRRRIEGNLRKLWGLHGQPES